MNKIEETKGLHKKHREEPNIKNRTVFCRDNLEVMRGINSECIDLIYLDPPFNKNKVFTSPIGTSAEGASFKDIFQKDDVDDEWLGILAEENAPLAEYINGITNIGYQYNKYYLIYMAIRLMEMKRILKNTGSIYLHCDPTMGHYLKILMDCIFGEKHFRNEIIWKRHESHSDAKRFGRVIDCIFYYTKSNQFVWNGESIAKQRTPDEINRKYNKIEKETGRRFHARKLTMKALGNSPIIYEYKGIKKQWSVVKTTMEKYDMQGLLYFTKGGIYLKQYPEHDKGIAITNLFTDCNLKTNEATGYTTQKSLALLDRIIKASSNEGDVVLDPFCGCATTCVAAEKLGRRWIGIDISQKAYQLVQVRLKKEVWSNPDALYQYDKIPAIISRTDVPKKTKQDSEEFELSTDDMNMRDKKRVLYGQQAGICKGCELHFQIQNLTIDHIVPQESGGGDEIENLMLLCGHCNSVKGHRGDIAYLKAELKKKGIIK